MDIVDTILPWAASAAAIITYASNMVDVLRFRSMGNTGSKSCIPYAMMLASSLGWFIYGYIALVPAVMISNGIGFTLSSIMALGYTYYYSKQRSTLLPYFLGPFIYALCLYWAAQMFPMDAQLYVGSVCSVVAVLMFASPLATLQVVLETRSSESLPVGMVVVGLTCTTLWTLYGLRVGDVFMWGPNSLAMALGLVQLALIFRYPAGRKVPVLPLESIRKTPEHL